MRPVVLGSLGLAAVVAAVAAWWLSDVQDRPPNLKAIARSVAVDRADAAATARVDSRMRELALPWLDPAGVVVEDACQSRQDSVSCHRLVIRYFGFDGEFPGRVDELATAAREHGWPDFDPAPVLAGYRTNKNRGEFARTTVVDAARHEALVVRWVQRPEPVIAGADIETGEEPHQPDTVYRTIDPGDSSALSTQAFHSHRFVLAMQVTDDYFGDPPPPVTTPTRPPYQPCYSDGGRCGD